MEYIFANIWTENNCFLIFHNVLKFKCVIASRVKLACICFVSVVVCHLTNHAWIIKKTASQFHWQIRYPSNCDAGVLLDAGRKSESCGDNIQNFAITFFWNHLNLKCFLHIKTYNTVCDLNPQCFERKSTALAIRHCYSTPI